MFTTSYNHLDDVANELNSPFDYLRGARPLPETDPLLELYYGYCDDVSQYGGKALGFADWKAEFLRAPAEPVAAVFDWSSIGNEEIAL